MYEYAVLGEQYQQSERIVVKVLFEDMYYLLDATSSRGSSRELLRN